MGNSMSEAPVLVEVEHSAPLVQKVVYLLEFCGRLERVDFVSFDAAAAYVAEQFPGYIIGFERFSSLSNEERTQEPLPPKIFVLGVMRDGRKDGLNPGTLPR